MAKLLSHVIFGSFSRHFHVILIKDLKSSNCHVIFASFHVIFIEDLKSSCVGDHFYAFALEALRAVWKSKNCHVIFASFHVIFAIFIEDLKSFQHCSELNFASNMVVRQVTKYSARVRDRWLQKSRLTFLSFLNVETIVNIHFELKVNVKINVETIVKIHVELEEK